jgi:E3 ubiquitin-protein ligase SIAH1
VHVLREPAAGRGGARCELLLLDRVRSSALADGAGVATEKELYFAMPNEMLDGGNRELLLSVRIDPSLEDKKMITQS